MAVPPTKVTRWMVHPIDPVQAHATADEAARERKLLAVLGLTMAVVMFGFSTVVPLLPIYAPLLGASPLALGLLFSAWALAQFVCFPLWGALSDRIGRKQVLLAALLGYAASIAWLGLASDYRALLLLPELLPPERRGAASEANVPTVTPRVPGSLRTPARWVLLPTGSPPLPR